MEVASLLGLLMGWGALIAGFMMEGGKLGFLFAASAFIIIFFGTLGATTLSFPLGQIRQLPRFLGLAFRQQRTNSVELIDDIASLAERARTQGILSLEPEANTHPHPIMRKGIRMAVDGEDLSLIESVLNAETDVLAEEENLGKELFESMGGYSPTLGIIGTVLGLVHALGQAGKDIEILAKSIAMAFMATFYGVSFANLIFLPIANKLKIRAERMANQNALVVRGVIGIARGDNPYMVRSMLTAYLSTAERATQETTGEGTEVAAERAHGT